MSTQTRTLFQRFGGEAAIERMIARLYERVLADAALAPFFKHASMDKLRLMQREFFAVILDGPVRYSGLSLSWAHAKRHISEEHYSRFVDHVMQTLQEMGMAEQDVIHVGNRLSTYKNDITGEAY